MQSACRSVYYLPIVLSNGLPSFLVPFCNRPQQKLNHCRRTGDWRIGRLGAGRHKAPQPGGMPGRDVPKEAFFELAQMWSQRYQATLVSMQLRATMGPCSEFD